MASKRIAFISIPHIFAESEESRRGYHQNQPKGDYQDQLKGGHKNQPKGDYQDQPLIIVSGTLSKSVVIDHSKTLYGSPVRKGMFLKDIASLKGKIKVLPADYEYVEKLDKTVADRLKNYSPSIENAGTGEYYMDLTGTKRLFGREIDTCGRIIRELRESLGLTASIGIGSTVLIARLASRVAEEMSAYDICETAEELFLFPLSVELCPELSFPVKKALLSNYNIKNIGELEMFTKNDLTCMFGKEGEILYNCSRGLSRDRLMEKNTEKILMKKLIVNSEDNDDGIVRRYFFSMVLELCTQGPGKKNLCKKNHSLVFPVCPILPSDVPFSR